MEYPKIQSLFMRDMKSPKKNFMPEYAREEFAQFNTWRVEEKIDGTNIRVSFFNDIKPHLSRFAWDIKGKRNDSLIPKHLYEVLEKLFNPEKLALVFSKQGTDVQLFGEGYGNNIQAGHYYRQDPSFILFDVKLDGRWLPRGYVKSIADELGVPMPADLGTMTTQEVIEFVKSKPLSRTAQVPHIMEGVIARTDPLMLFCHGTPLMWKLKVKDLE